MHKEDLDYGWIMPNVQMPSMFEKCDHDFVSGFQLVFNTTVARCLF
jgi:hypothetical protein